MQITWLSGIGALLSGAAAALTVYNAWHLKHAGMKLTILQNYERLTKALQAEVERLHEENDNQRRQIQALTRRLATLERRSGTAR
jgi:phage shock protein A